MIANLYLSLSDYLLSITDNNQPVFLHVDLWNQQMLIQDKETVFQMPAVFIEFTSIQWKQMGQKVQDSDLRVNFHIITSTMAQSSSKSQYRDVAINRLRLSSLLHYWLTRFSTEYSGTPIRIASNFSSNFAYMVKDVETYIIPIRDMSATNIEIIQIVSPQLMFNP